jgi:hypothetical protein
MNSLENGYYLERNEAIVADLQKTIDSGVVFESNLTTRTETGVIVSSLGKFYSPTVEQDIYVGVSERRRSSAQLETIFNLGWANWYTYNHTRSLDRVSAFYAVLVDAQEQEIGMLFEDWSHGGVGSLNDVLVSDLAAREDIDDQHLLNPLWNAEELFKRSDKVVNFRPLLPSVVLTESISIPRLDDFIENKRVPAVRLPYTWQSAL